MVSVSKARNAYTYTIRKNEDPLIIKFIQEQTNFSDVMRYLMEKEISANGIRDLSKLIPSVRELTVSEDLQELREQLKLEMQGQQANSTASNLNEKQKENTDDKKSEKAEEKSSKSNEPKKNEKSTDTSPNQESKDKLTDNKENNDDKKKEELVPVSENNNVKDTNAELTENNDDKSIEFIESVKEEKAIKKEPKKDKKPKTIGTRRLSKRKPLTSTENDAKNLQQ